MDQQKDLRALVVQCIAAFAPLKSVDTVSDETVLSQLGLDSIALYQFITKLEANLGIPIPDAELSSANFKTVGAILQTLARITAGAS